MTDISKETDLLLQGAAPERYQEIKALWGERADRVRLLETEEFLLQHIFGTVQTTARTLDAFWLAGFASWKAIEAYSGIIVLLAHGGMDFDPIAVARLPGQAEADQAFDRALGHVHDLLTSATARDFAWPTDVPTPDRQITNPQQRAARDLVYIAGAYVILHELGHHRIDESDCAIGYDLREERLCDAYARKMLLDGTGAYSASTGDPEHLVRAKRLLGILLAKLLIITVTPRDRWMVSPDHEPVRRRLFRVLRYAKDPLPGWFWDTAAALLAAFARRHGVLTDTIRFGSSRELAFALCRKFV
ncbi:phage exclusion protein Lit family protein [Bradyrhizobium vignae]|uniref:Uncharacterized protein n=1 Tax=Bradyrhizobium vignae TaxID=1549949 RepID=A0ABS3ZXB6_9BRAD|nr:phage exclusion protein Lit family protein [Bradyrhizobium vignae]MBP0112793.1 hypothetical protein [Bradyrhizobium vignae]